MVGERVLNFLEMSTREWLPASCISQEWSTAISLASQQNLDTSSSDSDGLVPLGRGHSASAHLFSLFLSGF